LVEGKDEVRFYSAIRGHTGRPHIEIRSFEGVGNLRGTLEALRGVEGFDRLIALGIVRDAEGNGRAALQSVRDALQANGFSVPDRGLERAGVGPAVVILINPHEEPNGRFEDVCARSVRGTATMNCVEKYIACLKTLPGGMPVREWKTRVHSFIAAQEHPEVSLGVAATHGYFPFDSEAFSTVRRLFELLDAP
jgi:copper chaperone CopZ